MKRKLTSAAVAATLCAAAGGALAGPPSDLQLFVTICSNNGNGNGNEVVLTTGLRCLKFQDGIPSPIESPTFPNNNQLGEEGCTDGADCDPKPAE